jgi:hypothetical protein
MSEPDTIKRIVEDTFLTAANIHYGGDFIDELYVDDPGSEWHGQVSTFRILEVVINLGERLAQLAGLHPDDVWMPDDARHLIEWEYIK